jgi:hypothetical protein
MCAPVWSYRLAMTSSTGSLFLHVLRTLLFLRCLFIGPVFVFLQRLFPDWRTLRGLNE